eukprot:UN33629
MLILDNQTLILIHVPLNPHSQFLILSLILQHFQNLVVIFYYFVVNDNFGLSIVNYYFLFRPFVSIFSFFTLYSFNTSMSYLTLIFFNSSI